MRELLEKYFKKELPSDLNYYIRKFQEENKLKVDGIVGSRTMYCLKIKTMKKLGKKGIASNKIKTGFNKNYLVNSKAYINAYNYVEKTLNTYGTGISSSGSIRSLNASITAGRVSTSLHYLLRAIDLYVDSFMNNPNLDDYVCCYNGDRTYTVHARKKTFDIDEKPITLENVATYDNRKGIDCKVTGYFVNLTELFLNAGFQNIRCRKSFIDNSNSSKFLAEIWHFQYVDDLEEGVTFGECLYQVYGKSCFKSEVYKQNKYKKLYKNEKRFR